MGDKNNQPSQPELNLGLLSLVGEADKRPPSQQPFKNDKLLESLSWIEHEIKRGFLPKMLVAERLIAAAPGLSQQEASLRERIEALRKELSELLPSAEKEIFSRRFEEAARQQASLIDDHGGEKVEAQKWITSEISEKAESWDRFASMVKESSEKREQEAGHQPVPQRARLSQATLLVLLFFSIAAALFWFQSSPDASVRTEYKFARVGLLKTFASIADDSLMLPTLEPLLQVNALTSLVSEINSQSSAGERPQRVRLHQTVLADRNTGDQLESIPQPEAQSKEALSIDRRDEPAALRDIQDKPEQAIQEHTFEFPPYIHNKPEPTPDAVYADIHIPSGGKAVIHFSRPRRYEITAATQVMARPSYWAAHLADKDPGDTVEVDAIIGVWLRIHDNLDGSGYILAQDAEPSR